MYFSSCEERLQQSTHDAEDGQCSNNIASMIQRASATNSARKHAAATDVTASKFNILPENTVSLLSFAEDSHLRQPQLRSLIELSNTALFNSCHNNRFTPVSIIKVKRRVMTASTETEIKKLQERNPLKDRLQHRLRPLSNMMTKQRVSNISHNQDSEHQALYAGMRLLPKVLKTLSIEQFGIREIKDRTSRGSSSTPPKLRNRSIGVISDEDFAFPKPNHLTTPQQRKRQNEFLNPPRLEDGVFSWYTKSQQKNSSLILQGLPVSHVRNNVNTLRRRRYLLPSEQSNIQLFDNNQLMMVEVSPTDLLPQNHNEDSEIQSKTERNCKYVENRSIKSKCFRNMEGQQNIVSSQQTKLKRTINSWNEDNFLSAFSHVNSPSQYQLIKNELECSLSYAIEGDISMYGINNYIRDLRHHI